MKKPIFKKVFVWIAALFLMQGCVVISFYPLFKNSDLFENDILTGQWLETEDNFTWKFVHPTKNQKDKTIVNNKGYHLTLSNEADSTDGNVYEVNIVEIENEYYLDFYLVDCGSEKGESEFDQFIIANFHLIPVHSFAKLEVTNDSLLIRWFSSDWLEDKTRKNKLHIRHEDNGEFILLTASTEKLQKFIQKYGNEEDAYDMEIQLVKQKHETKPKL